MPLSFTPSQSLSLPSHSSIVGKTPPTQVSTPALHWRTPCLHSPTLVPQAWPTVITPASIMPLQLLSRPSQTSGLGAVGAVQVQAPPAHTSEPWLQGAVSVPLSL